MHNHILGRAIPPGEPFTMPCMSKYTCYPNGTLKSTAYRVSTNLQGNYTIILDNYSIDEISPCEIIAYGKHLNELQNNKLLNYLKIA